MTHNQWRLPANVDPNSVKFVNGIILFETSDTAPYQITGKHNGETIEHALVVDPVAKTATLDGNKLDLTFQGFYLLLEFARQPEAYLSAKELYERVWLASYDSVKTRCVDLAVYRLRKHFPSTWLRSKSGLGWRLLPPE